MRHLQALSNSIVRRSLCLFLRHFHARRTRILGLMADKRSDAAGGTGGGELAGARWLDAGCVCKGVRVTRGGV